MKVLWLLSAFLVLGHGYFLHMYCGSSDCYKLLGVSKKATRTEVQQAYSTIQQKYEEKDAEQKGFTNAYNILSNADTRKHYDYMLDNPNKVLYNYYQYFKIMVSPNSSFLVVVSIVLISLIQYFHKKHSYWSAVRTAMKNPKNRSKALHKVQEQHLLYDTSSKLSNKEKKERRKKEEERALRQIIQESIKCTKPRLSDTLFIQLIFSPYFFLLHMRRGMHLLSRFDFFSEEYEDINTYHNKAKRMKKSQTETTTSTEGPNLSDVDLSMCEDSHSKTDAWINDNKNVSCD